MKKKTLFVFVVLAVIMVMVLVGCGSSESTPSEKQDTRVNEGVGDVVGDSAVDSADGSFEEITSQECSSDDDCKNVGHDFCQMVMCDLGTHRCKVVADPQKDGVACDDGNLCTEYDRCEGGVCKGRQKDCGEAKDECHKMVCVAETGSCEERVKVGASCDDGNECTDGDKCTEAGICVGEDNGKCQCSSEEDCIKQGYDICKGPVKCEGHKCIQDTSKPVVCEEPQDPCKESYCDSKDGQCKEREKEEGSVCDDGNPCTIEDRCNGGVCKGKAKDCDDKNQCTQDSCNIETGKCEHKVMEGADCDDGNICTQVDKCDASGKCVGSEWKFGCCNESKDCDDGYGCSEEKCDGHECKYSLKGCNLGGGGACIVGACLDKEGSCEGIKEWRIVKEKEIDFTGGEEIAGVRIEGEHSYEKGKGLKGEGDIGVYLPVLPVIGRGIMLEVEGGGEVEGLEEIGSDGESRYYWKGGVKELGIKIGLKSGEVLKEVRVYGVGGSDVCGKAKELVNGNVGKYKVVGSEEGFVVVWVENEDDGSSVVKVQVFDVSGEKVGDGVELKDVVMFKDVSGYYDDTKGEWELWLSTKDGSRDVVYRLRLGRDGKEKGDMEELKVEGGDSEGSGELIEEGSGCLIEKKGEKYLIECRVGDKWNKVKEIHDYQPKAIRIAKRDGGYYVTWLRSSGGLTGILLDSNGSVKGNSSDLLTGVYPDYRIGVSGNDLVVIANGREIENGNLIKVLRYHRLTYKEGLGFLESKKFDIVEKGKEVKNFNVLETGDRIYVGVNIKGETGGTVFEISGDGIAGSHKVDLGAAEWIDITRTGWKYYGEFEGGVYSGIYYLVEGEGCEGKWSDGGKVCVFGTFR